MIMADAEIIKRVLDDNLFDDEEYSGINVDEKTLKKGFNLSYDEVSVLDYLNKHPEIKEKFMRIFKEKVYDYEL